MKGGKEKLSMEQYLDLVVSPNHVDLKIEFLNQIISMHGFKKIHKTRKSVVSDAVNALDLMDPSRSTLKENISSCASIALDEIIGDLNDLSWQECCVTSIKTLSSSLVGVKMKNNGFSSPRVGTGASKVSKSRVRFAGDACGVGGEPSASTSLHSGVDTDDRKTNKKRKRSVRPIGWC